MLQVQQPTLVRERIVPDFPFSFPVYYDANREEILRVLERAASDNRFIAQLTHHSSDALRDYHLTNEEKAALLSGDVGWLEEHIGELDARARTWLDCRLQQEIW